ncbi:ubiquinol-cytochrome C reductase [Parathielavia appendiculata]|uniref:Complex III subunit 9 n=1 Tax=Parathielavia appendiculata TaxID=2587402 RepID=A0AAN6UA99_9PEZI|nr:ubiquinol-cytochrome C reductase [Parathielavia appendiculata]
MVSQQRTLQASPLPRTLANPNSTLTLIASALFRRNYTMLALVFTGAFAFEMGYDNLMNKVWDNYNRGRQWKDIRHKYVEGGDDE